MKSLTSRPAVSGLFALLLCCSGNALAEEQHEHGEEAGHEGHHDGDEHGDKHGDKHGDEHGHGGHEEHEEGVVTIKEAALTRARVELGEVKAAKLKTLVRANGRIAPVSSRVAHITSRFAGIVKEVRRDIGDQVKAGDVLAVVESNQNLQSFEVRTLKSGLITERHATIGEFATEGTALFVIVDLSELWADFTVFQRDVGALHEGQEVVIRADAGDRPIESTIRFISPIVDETTQSRIVRAVITSPPRTLAPGAFITGEIAVAEFEVPLAVDAAAIQTVEGRSAVFVQEGERFEARPIELGRSDGTLIEVLSGLKAGERYVAKNSFILKAELGKSEAEHEH